MINLDDFEKYSSIKPLIDKINKYHLKNKRDKVQKLLDDLFELVDLDSNLIPITYILSIIAEKDVSLISDSIMSGVIGLLDNKDIRVKLNSLSIVGFRMVENPEFEDAHLFQFIKFLNDKDRDIRENVYFFLQKLKDAKNRSLCKYKNEFISALRNEKDDENIFSLITILTQCSEFTFPEQVDLRNLIKVLYSRYFDAENERVLSALISLAKTCFPDFNANEEFNSYDLKEKQNYFDALFIMKKFVYNFDESNKIREKKKKIKDLSDHNDDLIYFYVKNNEEKEYYFYEFERSKLLSLFSRERLSNEDLSKIFNPILKSELELNLIISTLLRFKFIEGYYSELGYFYPLEFLINEFQKKLQENGMINLKKYNYLPPKFIEKVIMEISVKSKQSFLKGKNDTAFYSLKKIVQQINKEAAKSCSIDLNSYKERLIDEEYQKLVNNLPKEYLVEHHKDTHWLTNLGLLKINQEIDNSKILGYLSIPSISEKYNIPKILLGEIIEKSIDYRSGVFDINKEVFYYSKFLKEKFEKINQIKDVDVKEKTINLLARELNIKKNQILSKIDENLQLLGKEIKEKEEIKISSYLEKTGMNFEAFLKFIKFLGLPYFKKGDTLVLNETKIKEAKLEIKEYLIKKSLSSISFSLAEFDISPSIVNDLLLELLQEEKIKGIFYEDQGEKRFYSEKGINNMMIEENFLFSFTDFFPNKELSESEINLLKSVLDDLIVTKRLNGTFDQETLTFSSNDVIFAQNYNIVLAEFEKLVNNYNSIFLIEFKKIKNILKKIEQTIFPQEIKSIQDSIDRINTKSIKWRHELDAFIRRANTELLKKQGYTVKKYKELSSTLGFKNDIKLFEDDDEVKNLMGQFQDWIKLFNNIELKYGNVIFYQKRVINDPSESSYKEKLKVLLAELKII